MKYPSKIKKLLIIPDGHASPFWDNDRFADLGKFIKSEKPDVIVNLGDLADMPSLSSYDRGKASFEGRRYADDLVAVRDALKLLGGGTNVPKPRRSTGSASNVGSLGNGVYSPKRFIVLGNHEHRINRLVNDQPELNGQLSVDDLGYAEYGWEVLEYRSILSLGGIAFSHDFPTGISGKTISGENVARSLIQKNLVSSVCGHLHTFDHSERTRIDGLKIFGLSAGCYTHPKMIEGWNKNTHHFWWRGVVMLEGVENGYYDKLTAITQRDLKASLGSV